MKGNKRKKKKSFFVSRRFAAAMLAFAICLTLSGFQTLAAYGGTDSDTETVDTSDTGGAAVTAPAGDGTNDGKEQQDNVVEGEGNTDTDADKDSSTDTDVVEDSVDENDDYSSTDEDLLISPYSVKDVDDSEDAGTDEPDYSVWFESNDEEGVVFSNSELTLTLNIENLENTEAEIEWIVNFWNNEDETIRVDNLDGSYYAKAEDGSSITLDGKKIFDVLGGAGGIEVFANVVVDERIVYTTDIYPVQVAEPEFEWEDGDYRLVLPGAGNAYDNWQGAAAWIRDANYPEGAENVPLTILTVDIDTDGVLKQYTTEDNTLLLSALPEGIGQSTDVRFTAEDEYGNEYSFIMTFEVTGEDLWFNTYEELENGKIDFFHALLPGTSMQLVSELFGNIYDAETGERNYDVKMNVTHITYSYDNEEYPDLLTVTEDGLVTAKNIEDLDEEIWTGVMVTASYVREDGTTGEYTAEVWVCVSSDIERWETPTLYLEPGDTVSAEDLIIYRVHYTPDNPDGEVLSEIPVEFFDTGIVDGNLIISEDGKTLTVPEDFVVTDEPYKTNVFVLTDGWSYCSLQQIQISKHEQNLDEGTGGTDGTIDTSSAANTADTTVTNGADSAADTTDTNAAASPRTGDETMMLLWIVIAAGAVGVLSIVGAKRRRSY